MKRVGSIPTLALIKTLIGDEQVNATEAGFDETWIDNDDLRIKITPFISLRGQR